MDRDAERGGGRHRRARAAHASEGTLWDPYRQSLELVRLDEAAGLLAIDPRTEPAHRALGHLRRQMEALSHLVRERWQDDMQEYFGMDPDDIVDEVAMRDDDDLGPLEGALDAAARELQEAMRRLNS